MRIRIDSKKLSDPIDFKKQAIKSAFELTRKSATCLFAETTLKGAKDKKISKSQKQFIYFIKQFS